MSKPITPGVVLDRKLRGWFIEVGRKQYLNNNGELVTFTVLTSEVVAGVPSSIWFTSKESADEVLQQYLHPYIDSI